MSKLLEPLYDPKFNFSDKNVILSKEMLRIKKEALDDRFVDQQLKWGDIIKIKLYQKGEWEEGNCYLWIETSSNKEGIYADLFVSADYLSSANEEAESRKLFGQLLAVLKTKNPLFSYVDTDAIGFSDDVSRSYGL